jgi:hypothetical protein
VMRIACTMVDIFDHYEKTVSHGREKTTVGRKYENARFATCPQVLSLATRKEISNDTLEVRGRRWATITATPSREKGTT